MELQGERLIPAPLATTWAALNNPEDLKSCITGCESLERTGDDSFLAVVAVKVGPVSARFKGKLQLSDVLPPHSYTIHFDGQGGVAGFGKGSADVVLAEEAGQTRLRYNARAQVGGKMAQVGSRLIDAAASKIAEDFFRAFDALLTSRTAATENNNAAPLPEAAPGPVAPELAAESPVLAHTRHEVEKAAEADPQPEPDTNRSLLWVGAVCVLLVLAYLLLR